MMESRVGTPAESGYRAMIREVVSEHVAPAGAIEALMRVSNGGVLDHLTRQQFFTEAALAASVWTLLSDDDRRFYEMEGSTL
jgi:hypothetical protein